MDFISIDFETANEQRVSACSLGITVVKSGIIVEKFYTLIKPRENKFNPMNIWIHGISEEDVEEEKSFKELWPTIKKYIDGNLVIAHNAYFDIDVLLNLLNSYNLKLNNCTYLCTVDISKKVYEGLPNNKLATLAEMLNIEFNHHNACDDSMVAAYVFLDVCKFLNINKFSDIEKKLKITPGYILFNNNIKPIIQDSKLEKVKKASLIDTNSNIVSKFFEGKTVVFTGPLTTMSRAKASAKVLYLGGFVSNSVNSKTNLLITNLSIENTFLTSKMRKAKSIITSGGNLEILSESEFLKLIQK